MYRFYFGMTIKSDNLTGDNMPRFFVKKDQIQADTVTITGEDARHISLSLRMKPHETLILCDGINDYNCEIISTEKDRVTANILKHEKNTSEAAVSVSVYQCIPKSDKLETVIQKCTELGAFEFIPVKSSRCVSKIDPQKEDKKLTRLQKTALEAAKQSGRGVIPLVHPPLTFEKAVASAAEKGSCILFYENGGVPLKTALQDTENHISVFVGPEGGF